MNLFHFLFLGLILVHISNAITVQDFVETLQEDFARIERGENASMIGGFEFRIHGKVWLISFEFLTRNQPIREWAFTISVSDGWDVTSQIVYKSVYTDGKLYVKNNRNYGPDLNFIDDFLTKGPRVQSIIAEWLQENGSEHIEVHGLDTIKYEKTFGSERNNGILKISRKFDINGESDSVKFLLDYSEDGFLFRSMYKLKYIKLYTNQVFDDKVFKITDEMVLVSDEVPLSQRLQPALFMGLWRFFELRNV